MKHVSWERHPMSHHPMESHLTERHPVERHVEHHEMEHYPMQYHPMERHPRERHLMRYLLATLTLMTACGLAAAELSAADLPPAEVGYLTPEMIVAAQEPTGRESQMPLENCIQQDGSDEQWGDWCPSIFNNLDTAHYARGTTLIWHILVEHAGGSFEQDEIDLVGARAAQAKQYYRDHAPSNAYIRFDHEDGSGFYYYRPTVPYVIDFEDGDPVDDDWVNDACIALGVPDQNGDGYYTDDLTLGLQSWQGWDNVIAVFQPADVWLRANASVSRGACQVPPFEFWQVYAHEWGHCFGACDEYEENGSCNGNDCDWICQSCYLTDDVPNGNCEVGGCPTQTCIMKYETSGGFEPPCSYTERNWAWIDTDDNGLLDGTIWNRGGIAENMYELFHGGWFIHTDTSWGMVANQRWTSWGAIGVRARDASTCYEIDVYGDNNHRWHLADSDLNTRVNFVVGDWNHNNLGQDHIRLTKKFGSAQYVLNHETGTQVLYPDGVPQPKTWDALEVVRTYDVPLFGGTTVHFDLDVLSNQLDLGMALFRSNGSVYYAGRSDAVAISASGGPGADESFDYTAPAEDIYGLVVFANSEVDGDWEIVIAPDPSSADESVDAPSDFDLRLVGANPATGPSRLRLALPSTSEVEASVFDVRGRFVRLLERGLVNAGHHDLSWDGRDEQGRPAGSGMYFVRAVVGEENRSVKVLRAE